MLRAVEAQGQGHGHDHDLDRGAEQGEGKDGDGRGQGGRPLALDYDGRRRGRQAGRKGESGDESDGDYNGGDDSKGWGGRGGGGGGSGSVEGVGLPALIQRTKRRQTELDGLLYQLTTATTALAARADERLYLARGTYARARAVYGHANRTTRFHKSTTALHHYPRHAAIPTTAATSTTSTTSPLQRRRGAPPTSWRKWAVSEIQPSPLRRPQRPVPSSRRA